MRAGQRRCALIRMTVCLLGGALACPWVARAEAEGVPGVGRPIRIACIGDSITDFDTYETNLQNMLNAAYALSGKHPPKYEVRNFGVSGTTALDQSASYMKTAKYRDALACNPDIVYIQLGTNDSRRGKTYDSIGQFAGDYTRLVKSFLELPGKPRVYLSAPPTMPNEGHWGDNDLTLVTGVIPRIHAVARTFNLPVIDQHTPTSGHPEWVSDNVHPSRETAGRVMAAALYRAITGLQPPATLYPPVWFVPTSNLLASKTPVQDIKAILEAHKPGDYFLAGRVRLGSLTSGSQTATLTIALVDDKGKHAFSSDTEPICTGTSSNLRAVKTIAWSGTLARAALIIAAKGGGDPLLVDDVILQKYPYTQPAGQANAPSYLTAEPASETEMQLSWTENANDWAPEGNTKNETGFQIEWATNRNFTRNADSVKCGPDTAHHTVKGLKAGTTYYFRARAFNAAGETDYTNVAAATTKGAAAGPATPTDLAAPAIAGSEVRLTWTDNADSETGYRVQWASDPDFVTNAGCADVAANSTSHTVTGLCPSSTYAFCVRALGNVSDSPPSNVVQKVTWRATPNGTALHLTAALADAGIALMWADDCTNQTGYSVEYAMDAEFSKDVGALTTKANTCSATVTGLKTEAKYYFRVRPINALGSGDNITTPPVVNGPYSETISLQQPPLAPAKLGAWIHSSRQVKLSWTDNSSVETGFRVDRATDSAFAKDLTATDVPANATSCSVTGLNPKTIGPRVANAPGLVGTNTYYFRVRTLSAGGESANSEAVSVSMPDAGTPCTPSGLTAATASSSGIKLAWTDNAGDETAFAIDCATDSGFTKDPTTANAPANATDYNATGLKPATTYWFRVRAVNGAGASANSNLASATTLPLPPAIPGPLTVSRVTHGHVALTWTDNSDNEAGFTIERARDTEFTKDLVAGTVAANVICFTAANLEPKTAYYFRVRAHNSGGESRNCDTIEVTTPAATKPSAPSDLTGTAFSAGQVNLFWIATSTNETGFKIERATDAGFTKDLASMTAGANTTCCNIAGLAPATTYCFRVRSFNAVGESASTAAFAATTRANELLAGESFDGTPGAKADGSTSGSGWSSAWKTADSYSFSAGSLSYTDGHNAALITTGNRLVLSMLGGEYREAKRSTEVFSAKMKGGKPLEVWFSCLLNPGKAVLDFNPWGNEAYNIGPLAQGGAKVRYVGGNTWSGGSESGKSAPEVSLKPEQVNLVICHYEVAADLHFFTWTWYMNPSDLRDPLGSAAKTVWTASNAGGTLRGLNGFSVRNRPEGKSGFELDEIRYGGTPAQVTQHIPAAAAPSGLTATSASANEIDLAWTDNADSQTGFVIYRATDAAFTQNVATTTVAPNSKGCRISGLAANTRYYFRVRAINAAGESANCDQVNATTALR